MPIQDDIADEKMRPAAARSSCVGFAHRPCGEEERARFLADSIQQIVWTADADFKLDFCNQFWLEYSGMSFEQTAELGCGAIMHPEDVDCAKQRRKEGIEAGSAYECEYRLRRAGDGMYRWHLGRTTPRRDESGRIVQWIGTCVDIHERKISAAAIQQANDELEKRVAQRASELAREHRFLEAVLENVADGIVVCDEHGTLKLFNRTTRELHGLPEEPLPAGQWAEHYSLFRADGVTPMEMDEIPLFRAFNGETVRNAEFVIAPSDGRLPRRILGSGRAFYGADGKKLGAVIAMHDLTAQTAAEERFRTLFDNSSVAKFLLQDGKILDCNNAAVQLLGCVSKGDVLKLSPVDFSPEHQPDGRCSATTWCEIDWNVIVTGFDRFEWNLRRRDGSDVFADVSLTAIKIDGKPAIIAACHDVTERKRGEQALADAKRFAENVAEHSRCSIYLRDLRDESLVYLNREAREFIGSSRMNDVGGPEFNRGFVHPDDLGKVLAARESIKNHADGEVLQYTTRCRHVSGEWRSLLHRQVIFQRDSEGRPVQVMGTAHDITDLLRTQEELMRAKETAEAATRAKSEFLANMSHEIRTPMTAILGYTDLLADPRRTPEQHAEYVKVVKRNGEHLLAVLNDILDISKIEAGKLKLEMLDFDPSDVLAEVRTLMSGVAAEKNIVFGVEQRGQLPQSIISDPTRLKQILLNLVGNAIKFTPAGSVRVCMSVEAADSQLRFDVTDTGIGISAGDLTGLFTPFVQADASTTRRFGGSGLGLAICKRMAGLLGGDLSVLSQVGKGSTFTLRLPVTTGPWPVTSQSMPSDRADNNETASQLTGRILVAEDAPDTRRLVILYVENAGATVEAVSNGLLAVDAVVAAAAAGKPFDAVLMDMQMPGVDGYHATARLRDLGFDRLPIIAFTAHALAGEIEKCTASGCNGYVCKPINRDSLLKVLGTHLSAAAGKQASPIRSLRMHDKLMKQILVVYIEGLPQHVADILISLEQQDLSLLNQRLHQLKGSGGSYGFPEITRLAQLAEESVLQNAPVDQITDRVQSLLGIVRQVEGYDRQRESELLVAHTAVPA